METFESFVEKLEHMKAMIAPAPVEPPPPPPAPPVGDEARRTAALRTLDEIAADASAPPVARVAAAKAILDETAPDVRAHLLRLLKGDRAKLRAWLLAELTELDKAEAK